MVRHGLAGLVAIAAMTGSASMAGGVVHEATTTETSGAVVVHGVEIPYRITMDEAGRVCELGLRQKLDFYRAGLRVEGNKFPSEQPGDRRHGQVVEDRLDHDRELLCA